MLTLRQYWGIIILYIYVRLENRLEVNMNIALRKLAMLEKDLIAREEAAKFEGYTTSPVDSAFREKITQLMDKVRVI